MKISFKHRSNLYLNCNRTSSVYHCNNVNVDYQQPTCASSQNQVTNSHRPVHAYRKLPEFAIMNYLFFKIVNRSQLLLNTI